MLDFWKRKTDLKEPEVRKAALYFALFFLFLVIIDFYSVFIQHIDDLKALFLALTGGLVGLLGISIAGIAIVISMFTPHDIKLINDLKPENEENAEALDSFSQILTTYKYFAYDIILGIILFLGIYVLLLTNIPVPAKPVFYLIAAAAGYFFFYILFYGLALLENCLDLSKIKCLVDELSKEEKSKFDTLNELGLEQLVEIIYQGSDQQSKSFYRALLQTVESGSCPDKDALIRYIRDRHLN